MARGLGFEPRTYGLEDRCSILLSYPRNDLYTNMLRMLKIVGIFSLKPKSIILRLLACADELLSRHRVEENQYFRGLRNASTDIIHRALTMLG